MSKIGPINGDLADGMVGSMDTRTIRSRDFLREDWSDKVSKVFSCDVDHMYASVNDVQAKDREIHALKESLIVNLTLIQHQSDELLAREKEIAALREERDTLRLRFERMERRVTLQRHKDEPGTPMQVPQAIGNHCEPSIPRPSQMLSIDPCLPDIQTSCNVNTKRRRVSQGVSFRRKTRTISTGSDRTKISRSASESNDTERRGRSRAYITSNKQYYTLIGECEPWRPADLAEIPDDSSKEEEQVQVPSWREKVLSPLYVIEGTENVEDEVYLKRHQKLENDERRRKRWDIQRIREQTQVERLKQREKKRTSTVAPRSPDQPVWSFFPAPEEVLEVQVSPCLPIVAFGLPLRTFDTCDFSLPWNVQGGAKYLSLRSR